MTTEEATTDDLIKAIFYPLVIISSIVIGWAMGRRGRDDKIIDDLNKLEYEGREEPDEKRGAYV